MAERVELLESPTWFLQPADRIVPSIAALFLAEPVFAEIFGEEVAPYKRMDFALGSLPALRIYSDTGSVESVTWYVRGEVKIDVILPLSTRREMLQQFADLLTSAMLAQFRRQPFFDDMRERVPGLNELGKIFSFDKGLAFRPSDSDDLVPMVQLSIGYRVLLEEWNRYLESDDRTVDDPFVKTLGDLRALYVQVLAKDDAGQTQVTDVVDVAP